MAARRHKKFCEKIGKQKKFSRQSVNAICVGQESSPKIGRRYERQTEKERKEEEKKRNAGNRQKMESWKNYPFFLHNELIGGDRDSNSCEPSLSCSQLSHLWTKTRDFCPLGGNFGLPFFLPLDRKYVKPLLTQELSYHDFGEL